MSRDAVPLLGRLARALSPVTTTLLCFCVTSLPVVAGQGFSGVSSASAKGADASDTGLDLEVAFACLELCLEAPRFCLTFVCSCLLLGCGACLAVDCALSSRPRADAARSRSASFGSFRGALPEGVYRGWYAQHGRHHQIPDFSVRRDRASSRMRGSGVDEIGEYACQLLWQDGQLSLSKRYVRESPNVHGRRNPENAGHSVEYRGGAAGASAGQGFRGRWQIRARHVTDEGAFHIWPVSVLGPSSSPVKSGTFRRSYATTDDNICAVCFSAPIDTVAETCGHITVCRECARRLDCCPVCRAYTRYAPLRRTVGELSTPLRTLPCA